MRRALIPMLALLLIPAGCEADSQDFKKIELQIRKNIPDLPVTKVGPSPIKGLYEVVSGNNIYYADADGSHLISGGNIFDTKTRANLTAERLQDLNRVDWSLLPLNKAIVSGDPDGKPLAVFTDPDCPYCRKFETELKNAKGIKVYTFLMPLEQLHPMARMKSEAIWCAKDQHAELQAVMLEDKMPEKASCENPLADIAELAAQLNIHGTPTLIAGDGRVRSGGVGTAELSKWLNK